MKTIRIHFSVLVFAAAAGFAPGASAQTGDAKTPPPPPRSVFIQPTSAHDGRDPFWPESSRVWDSSIQQTHAAATEPTTLKVNGYSNVGGRPVVIINEVSFLNGDEADLPAAGGGHTHVHCIDIQPDHVVVEVNGVQREIRF